MNNSLRICLRRVLGVTLLVAPLMAWATSYVDVEQQAARASDPVERQFYQELADVHAKLAKVSGLKLRLLVSDEDEVNAYATESKGEKLVVMHWGLLEALQDDRDAMVAVLAHEYAHHAKDHMAKTQSTGSFFGVLGAVAGAVIDRKLGTSSVGRTVGKAGAKVATSAFSRDQEREADALGTQWLIEMGYNPLGAVRLQKKLMELAGSDDSFSLFRTHPPSKDRALELESLIAKNDAAKPLMKLPLVALHLPEDSEEDEAAPASAPGATRTALAPPAAASLLPIDGFSLERYAQYVNELVAAGEREQAAVLTKYKLTEASSGKLNEAWVARMQQDPGLSARYGQAYLEASVGPLAAWGRAVAQAQRDGKALSGEPPLPQADWVELSKTQRQLYANTKDYKQAAASFDQAARAKGLSAYDFMIANHWWMQLAQQQAQKGDTRLLQALSP